MSKNYLKLASDLVNVPENESDIKWAGQVMTKARQLKHADWKARNIDELNKSGLDFKPAGNETILFREQDMPRVDFYPSTGRWRVAGENKTYRGGAKKFISWYKKAGMDKKPTPLNKSIT